MIVDQLKQKWMNIPFQGVLVSSSSDRAHGSSTSSSSSLAPAGGCSSASRVPSRFFSFTFSSKSKSRRTSPFAASVAPKSTWNYERREICVKTCLGLDLGLIKTNTSHDHAGGRIWKIELTWVKTENFSEKKKIFIMACANYLSNLPNNFYHRIWRRRCLTRTGYPRWDQKR